MTPPEETLSFDLDAEEATLDPELLKRIERELKREIYNHAWTRWPFFIGGGLVAYAFGLAPLLGGLLVAIPVGATALLVAVGNAGYRFMHVGEQYEEKVAELEEELAKTREAEEKARIDRSVEFLRQELGKTNVPQTQKAKKELSELVQAFGEVSAEISLSKGGKFSATITGRFTELTKDAYTHGLRVLSCVLSLLREDPSLNREELTGNISRLQREISDLRTQERRSASELSQIKERELARLNERLEKIEWRDTMIENLLERSDACEEVMRSAREDLIRLRAENTADALDGVMSNLDSYVSVLVDVQEQIKKSRAMNV